MPHNIVELKVNWLGKFNRLIIALEHDPSLSYVGHIEGNE